MVVELCSVCERVPPVGGGAYCAACERLLEERARLLEARRRVEVRCGLCGERMLTWPENAEQLCFCALCQTRCGVPALLPEPARVLPCPCGGRRFVRQLEAETRARMRQNSPISETTPARIAGALVEERVCLDCGHISRHAVGELEVGPEHGNALLLARSKSKGPFR